MKELKVDVEDIALCMDNQERHETNFYLDTETGETIAIPDEVMTATEEGEFSEDLPAWELELLPQAKEKAVPDIWRFQHGSAGRPTRS